MQNTPGRSEIEGVAERIEAFAAGLGDDERDLLAYLLEAARGESAAAEGDGYDDTYSTPVSALLASVLERTTVTAGVSIRFFPWIRHGSPDFGDLVVKPSD